MNVVSAQVDLAMDIRGQGETLVMLHGWGMHSGIWAELLESLSAHFRVVCIDLPGHGDSATVCPLTLEAVTDKILAQVAGPAHWLGWSLGGSIAMHLLARAPERVKSLVLLAANPAFVGQENWPHGINARVLQNFAMDLQHDYQKTLQRFLALQTLSSQSAKLTLRQLREFLLARSEPNADTLQQGLEILLQADMRDAMTKNQLPCAVVLGQQDQLVPVSLAAYYHALPCRPQVATIAGAGHAPFLSHPTQTIDFILPFIQAQCAS